MKHLFKRKEEKFILSLSQASNIKFIALQGLSFSNFNQNGSLTDIRTTYLENDNFLIYHMKKSRQKKRYKIRIREYGKEGLFEKYVWIELKEKVSRQGYKSRFKLDRKYIDDFITGKDIYEHVQKRNSGIDNKYLSVLYNRIQELILKNDFYPRLVMQYQRLALQEESSQGVRLTFDYNLKGGILKRGDELFLSIEKPEYFDKYKSIVELKIGSVYPEAANEIKKRFSIKKQRFSKFVFGMESFFNEFPQSDASIEKKYIPFSEIVVSDKEYSV